MGKTKEEILELMGHEFNDLHSARWTYALEEKKWFGRRYLILEFWNGKVVNISFKVKYF